MEPKISQMFSNSMLCNTFYVYFTVFSVIALAMILTSIWYFATAKLPFMMALGMMINTVFGLGITVALALFYYRICNVLLTPDASSGRKVAAAPEYNMMM